MYYTVYTNLLLEIQMLLWKLRLLEFAAIHENIILRVILYEILLNFLFSKFEFHTTHCYVDEDNVHICTIFIISTSEHKVVKYMDSTHHKRPVL